MKSNYRMSMLTLVTLTVLAAIAAQPAFATVLEDYVKKPDANYGYKLANTITGTGYTGYVLDMTSQSWRSRKEVDRTLWQHWLIIIKPDKTSSDTALLWINGGSNTGRVPDYVDPVLRRIALSSNTIVADLRMVPNQPLVFSDAEGQKREDAIIAYTYDKYIKTGDETWPLLLPMVKSAVSAMDTVQKYFSSESKGKVDIKKFVVGGASKRGWTTWLTATVDSRVIAIMPLVIDVLNMDLQMKHHFGAYGFYAPPIRDYEEMKIFEQINTPKGQELLKIVDPFELRDRIKIPKYMINSTGDQFFVPDSSQFYFDYLKGEKYLRYVPNTDHGLGGSDTPLSMSVFYQSILNDWKRPKFNWQLKDDALIVKPISGKLKRVNLWQVTNPKARDFRREIIGRAWKSSVLTQQPDGMYIGRVPEPKKGWTAFFVEMFYDSDTSAPYKFTTQVHVVPDKLPFGDKVRVERENDSEKEKEEGKSEEPEPETTSDAVKSPEKVLYAELTPQEFRERIAEAPIAYLPLGTLEWHGEHLPIGSDGLQSYGFFIELAREVGGIVLPMLFLGPDRMQKVDGKELYGMDLYRGRSKEKSYSDQQLAGSAYWVTEETFRTIIEATLKQLKRAGFKIVVGHGHGPSTGFFRKNAKQWKEKFGLETFICWGSKYDGQGLGIMVDHAAMNETSLVMALRPELVQMHRLPKVEDGWPVGVSGRDPRIYAGPDVGKKAIKLQKERMAKILREALN